MRMNFYMMPIILLMACGYSFADDMSMFHAGKYRLGDHFLKHIGQDSQKQLIIDKMKKCFKNLNAQQKEMYIEIINETTEPEKESHARLLVIVDNACTMIGLLSANNFSVSKLVADAKKVVSNIFEKSKLSDFMDKALRGSVSALDNIENLDFNKMRQFRLQEKIEILKILQKKADACLQAINEDTLNESIVLHSSDDSDDDKFAQTSRSIGLKQHARTLAIMKYCKDIVAALAPICTPSQKIMFMVDRKNINPIINIVDLAYFSFDSKATIQKQNEDLQKQAEILQSQGLLEIPKMTIEPFYKQLREFVVKYDSSLYAHKIFDEIRLDHKDSGSIDAIYEKHHYFKGLAPDYKEYFYQDLNELLNAWKFSNK